MNDNITGTSSIKAPATKAPSVVSPDAHTNLTGEALDANVGAPATGGYGTRTDADNAFMPDEKVDTMIGVVSAERPTTGMVGSEVSDAPSNKVSSKTVGITVVNANEENFMVKNTKTSGKPNYNVSGTHVFAPDTSEPSIGATDSNLSSSSFSSQVEHEENGEDLGLEHAINMHELNSLF